jgi:hypothetical protein
MYSGRWIVFYMDINNYMQVQGARGSKESSMMKPTVKQAQVSVFEGLKPNNDQR